MYANATRLLLLLRALIIMILAAPVDATVALQFVTFALLSIVLLLLLFLLLLPLASSWDACEATFPPTRCNDDGRMCLPPKRNCSQLGRRLQLMHGH